ncbi:O-methyltransferase-domain-containing protein [Dunaliella salina]|uniref:O-methyltransferase-domain-containing protein n=1 Tax=Dunaliella salina TaxID=3046 RepID=A0ABQ7GBI8_DUNSA|nr:O-methyltransferase-domain-containing protein [Dunaliella salina]|eukprot:KAF5831956.1 O-methyltransferase-domain-containing protein [Dunaliella salina]
MAAPLSDPVAGVQDLIASWVRVKVTYTFARLNVADALQPTGTAKTCQELASILEAHEDSLYRVLRTAGQLGLVTEEAGDHESDTDMYAVRGGRRFVLTPMGEVLKEDHPTQFKYFSMVWGLPAHAESQNKLFETVKTGQPGCKLAFGADHLFQLLDKDPMEHEIFNQGMTSHSNMQGKIVAASYDFSKCKKVVDVGGSKGTLVQLILDAHPGLPLGISLDRKELIDTLPPLPANSRLQFATGDFFEPLPESVHGADVVLMKFIMHDWGDADCKRILDNCKAILAPGGLIMCVEMVMGETAGAAPGSLPIYQQAMDLTMLSVLKRGRERTLKDWDGLAASAGLKLIASPSGSYVWGQAPGTMVVMQPV